MADAIVKRSGKVAFMSVGGSPTRMRGFTELNKSKNATEYSRQYVDEDTERTDVTGYSESVSFAMDLFKGDAVHEEIVKIFDEEAIGEDATVTITTVDFTNGSEEAGYSAIQRTYAVVPSSEGDSTDAYTYSGDFKANGEKVAGTATSTDKWKTCTFTPDAAAE